MFATILAFSLPLHILPTDSALAVGTNKSLAAQAAIHPVANTAQMAKLLSHAPITHQFPPDFDLTLRDVGPALLIEVSTAKQCVPCGDLYAKLRTIGSRYGWQVAPISEPQAMMHAGKLGLPWVGHPVAFVRASADSRRFVPIAVGTDHAPNLARNIYLAAKMLTGVRAAVGVRALSKFTGIVGADRSAPTYKRKD